MTTRNAYDGIRAALATGLLVIRDPRPILRRIKRNEALELAAIEPNQDRALRDLLNRDITGGQNQ